MPKMAETPTPGLLKVTINDTADVLGHADAQIGGLALDERVLLGFEGYLCAHALHHDIICTDSSAAPSRFVGCLSSGGAPA